jgi:hypothetical protein
LETSLSKRGLASVYLVVLRANLQNKCACVRVVTSSARASTMSNDVPATEVLNYFFYKCGEANCWLPVALEGHGLYVGFSNSLPPAPTGNHEIATREPEATFQALTRQEDDNTHALASHCP